MHMEKMHRPKAKKIKQKDGMEHNCHIAWELLQHGLGGSVWKGGSRRGERKLRESVKKLQGSRK